MRLDSDPTGVQFAYGDITNSSSTRTMGGVEFTITQTVTDYYWNRSSQAFETTPVSSRPHSDFKLLEVSVNWANPLAFHVGSDDESDSQLGSGSAEISSIISSTVTATGRLALIDDLSGNPLHLPLAALPPLLPPVVPPVEIPPVTIPFLPGLFNR